MRGALAVCVLIAGCSDDAGPNPTLVTASCSCLSGTNNYAWADHLDGIFTIRVFVADTPPQCSDVKGQAGVEGFVMELSEAAGTATGTVMITTAALVPTERVAHFTFRPNFAANGGQLNVTDVGDAIGVTFSVSGNGMLASGSFSASVCE